MSLPQVAPSTSMSRVKAFGIHLSLSIAVLMAVAIVMLNTWYQNGLWIAAQADRLWLIVATVDVVIGPFLTLLIYRAHKPGLGKDLSVIVFIQLAFLAWGLHAVWLSRPVFLVALPHQFVLVTANEIPSSDMNSPRPEAYDDLPWFGPKIVAARLPSDPDEANYVVLQAMQGRDLTSFPEFYIPFEEMSAQLLENSRELTELGKGSAIQESLPGQSAEARWVPLTSRRGEFVAVIDPVTAEPVYILADRPPASGG